MDFVLSTDTSRYLRFFLLFAWGACGRRFKSGRPDQPSIVPLIRLWPEKACEAFKFVSSHLLLK